MMTTKITTKLRIAALGLAAAAVLIGPASAFAGDDEATPGQWTYNPGQVAGWTYNSGEPYEPTGGVTLGQPQQVDTTLTIAGTGIKLNPCVILKNC